MYPYLMGSMTLVKLEYELGILEIEEIKNAVKVNLGRCRGVFN